MLTGFHPLSIFLKILVHAMYEELNILLRNQGVEVTNVSKQRFTRRYSRPLLKVKVSTELESILKSVYHYSTLNFTPKEISFMVDLNVGVVKVLMEDLGFVTGTRQIWKKQNEARAKETT